MTARAFLPTAATFGALLHYLRRQARLTQRELAIATGYSESMISRLEHDERPPDVATILALFVPALHLEKQPEAAERLVELAQAARGEGGDKPPQRAPAAGERRPPVVQHRLPARLTSFVGRAEDVRAVARLLATARLVTLTGPGGCGKTSLAVETGRWLAGAGEKGVEAGEARPLGFDEVCLVELFPLTDSALLAQTVLTALGLDGNGDQPAFQTLLGAIHARHVLLVLDNCEHVVGGIVPFVQTLLQSCPNLRIAVTSRERLNIAAETIYLVAPLPCPQPDRLLEPASMMGFGAIRLFVERCRAIDPDFRLTAHNAGPVAQVCALLDGVPLALELGAAATATFSVQEIASRLQAHLLRSTLGSRTADPRHASIDDTVAWSYHLLAPAEQRMLAELAVFAGGWTVEALQHVCTGQAAGAGILRQLVQKSLVNVHHPAADGGRTRYSLLRAVHEYAAEQLAGSDAEEPARRRHFAWFCQLGVQWGSQVLGPQHRRAMAALDADHANLRVALAYGQGRPERAEPFARLAAALAYYWRRRGYVAESTTWLSALLANAGALPLGAAALAHAARLYEFSDELYCFGQNLKDRDELLPLLAAADALIGPCLAQGETQAAALLMLAVAGLAETPAEIAAGKVYVREARSILENVGDLRDTALAGILLARLLLAQDDLPAAQNTLEHLVADLEHQRMNWCLCEALWLQNVISQRKEDRTTTLQILEQIAKISEQEEYVAVIHDTYLTLAHFAPSLALAMGQQLLARQRDRGLSTMLCLALHQLGRIYLNAGHYQEAQACLDEVLQLYPSVRILLREPPGPQWSLIDRGQVARYLGDTELALACFDESIRLFTASPFPLPSVDPRLFRGEVRLERGELDAAAADFRRCLRVMLPDAENWGGVLINCLAASAEVSRRRGAIATAGRLYGKAAAQERAMRAAHAFAQPHVMAFYRSLAAALPGHRADPVFEAAWQEGERLTLPEAIDLALAA